MAGSVVTLFFDAFASSPSATKESGQKRYSAADRRKGDEATEARGLVRFATNVNFDIADAAGLFVMRINVIDDGWGKGSDFVLL